MKRAGTGEGRIFYKYLPSRRRGREGAKTEKKKKKKKKTEKLKFEK